LFATGFALLALALARAWTSPTARAFAIAGLVAGLCVLTRPSGIVVVPVVAACSLLVPGRMRVRLGRAAAFALATGLVLVSLATVNAVRYDRFAVAATVFPSPLYRLFVHDHLVDRDNGPASAELGQAIDGLVALEPYRSYGITAERVFREGTNFMSWDVDWLARREWGDEAGGRLRAVLWETVREHPRAATREAWETLLFYLRSGYRHPASSTSTPERDEPNRTFVTVGGRALRAPHGTELIPLPHVIYGWASDPSGGYVYDWDDPSNPALRFTDPAKQSRYAEDLARLASYDDELPARDGSRWLAARLNGFVANVMPASLFWLLVGVVALVLRRPAHAGFFVALLLAGLSIDLLHAISMPRLEEYGLPSAPLILVFALGALLARREDASSPGAASSA